MALMSEYGGDFELPPEGRHVACLVQFVDIGLQPGKFGSSHHAELAFELEGATTKNGDPMLAFKRVFNLSNRSKNFREVVRALSNMHNISDINTYDLIGKWCGVVVTHVTTDDGSSYANVECHPLKGRAPTAPPQSETIFFSLHPSEFQEKDLNIVSDRQREKIRASETYKTLITDRQLATMSKGKRAADTVDENLPF